MNNNEEIQKAIERLNDSIVLPHLSQRGKDLECVLSAAKQLADVQLENERMREALQRIATEWPCDGPSNQNLLARQKCKQAREALLSIPPSNAENKL